MRSRRSSGPPRVLPPSLGLLGLKGRGQRIRRCGLGLLGLSGRDRIKRRLRLHTLEGHPRQLIAHGSLQILCTLGLGRRRIDRLLRLGSFRLLGGLRLLGRNRLGLISRRRALLLTAGRASGTGGIALTWLPTRHASLVTDMR